MNSTEIGNPSHQLPQELSMDQSTGVNSCDKEQLPGPLSQAALVGSSGQAPAAQGLQGVSVEQGFLSDFISDDCDPSLAGIRSFQELLSFGVMDYENRHDGYGATVGASMQESCVECSEQGQGSDSNRAASEFDAETRSAHICENGRASGLPVKEESRAKVEGWGGWRYGENGEHKPKQRQQSIAYPGSTMPDVGLSSGSSSLDQQSIVVHLNTRSESNNGMEYENGIPSCIAEPGQIEQNPTKQEIGMPIWVKWRGKWQACIQCSMNDCSAATMKAMPTYSKKNYIVAFFPTSRMYSWIDTQHVCAISENPEPLAGGSHESARESVEDVDMPRRSMLRSVAATMCDISDRLPIKAVIETAQDPGVWKSFAKETVQSKDYSEIGKLLVRLSGMIVRKYLKSSWMNNYFSRWKCDCENAKSASSIERLNQELINAILWEEVSSLWDKSEQPTLGSDWKDWKEAAFEGVEQIGNGGKGATLKTVLTPSPTDSNPQSNANGSLIRCKKEPPTQQTWQCDGFDNTKFELSRKRSKLEIRRRVSYPVSDAELASRGHDQPLLSGGSTAQSVPITSFHVEQAQIETQKDGNISLSSKTQDNEEIGKVATDHSSTIALSGFALTSTQQSVPETNNFSPPLDPSSKRLSMNGRFCLAFVAHKNRQCTRFANEGCLYCCKHLNFAANEASENSDKAKHLPNKHREDNASFCYPGISYPRTSYESRDICRAMTKYGRRCAFRVVKGSIHCKRHSVQNDAICGGADDMLMGDEDKHRIQNVHICPGNVEPGAVSFPSASSGAGSLANSIDLMPSNWRRCIGWCKRNGEQCSHRAKVGMLHCKKHLWMSKLSGDSSSQMFHPQEKADTADQEKLLRSKCILDDYMRTALAFIARGDRDASWVKSKRELADKILTEASKDMAVADNLLRLVVQQKKNLEVASGVRSSNGSRNLEVITCIGTSKQQEIVQPNVSDGLKTVTTRISDQTDVGMQDQDLKISDKQADKLRCSICTEEFKELITLGIHWKTSHHREAQCFLKGYICGVCGHELTSRPATERHWKAQHGGLLETPAMPICMVCDESFTDFGILWEHVVSAHSDHLSGATALSAIPHTLQDVRHAAGSSRSSTVTDPYQGNGQSSLTIVSNVSSSLAPIPSKVDCSILKFKCKFCGQKFRLLPDLGRHHQAEHLNLSGPGLQTKKRKHLQPISSSTQQVESSGIVQSTSAARWKKRAKVVESGSNPLLQIKAAVQILKQKHETKNTNEETSETAVPLKDGHGLSGNGLLPCSGQKLAGPPTDDSILAVATSVCCVVHLCNVLENKHEIIPDDFPAKAIELCRRAIRDVEWIGEGFVCPNGCKRHVKAPDLVDISNVMAPCGVSLNRVHVKSGNSTEIISLDILPVNSVHASTLQITCKDVSFGQESVPIPCVVDEDVIKACSCSSCKEGKTGQVDAPGPWETFSYITRRILKPSLGLDTKNYQLGCSCKESKCLPESCDHVLLFDSDNTDACDIHGQPMHGRFPYDVSGQIILQEGLLVYECNSSCSCQEECTNRVLQKGVQVKLEVFKTPHKGWAVRAAQEIHRGTFVCEYLGEVLDDAEANKRGERYDTIGCSYLYDIDVHLDTSGSRRGAKPFVIDATQFGNVSRFINHSCAPNLINYQVLVESMDCQLAHIGLYASCDIATGEELAYDYRYKLLPGKGCPCHCGAASCRGRLY